MQSRAMSWLDKVGNLLILQFRLSRVLNSSRDGDSRRGGTVALTRGLPQGRPDGSGSLRP